jgi:hypothetical protein
VFVVVSHWGVLPMQSVEVRHWTQSIVVVLQTRVWPPPPPPPPHWEFIVQLGTHLYVLVSQARFIPQLLLPTHTTHWPAGEQ